MRDATHRVAVAADVEARRQGLDHLHAEEAAGVGLPVEAAARRRVEHGELEVLLGQRLGLDVAEVATDVDAGAGRGDGLDRVTDLGRPVGLHVRTGRVHRERVHRVARGVVDVARAHDVGGRAVR